MSVQTVRTVTALLDLALGLREAAARISATVARGQAEGRENLTPEELALLPSDDDLARLEQVAAIERARAAGR